MAIIDSFDRYYAQDRKTWRKWLEKNHKNAPGIWLIYYKKDSGKARVPYADAVEEALCYGWIDSTQRPLDEESYMQLFMPRKSKSGWSKLNKERIERLIAEGMMTPAGMEKIELAKQNGSWSKLDSIESFDTPVELKKALAKPANKKAKKFFDDLNIPSPKKYVIYWISSAKLPVTKDKRIAEFIESANEGRLPTRFYPKKK
ncbi:YdeI/OmpD-associated family protein [Polluticoccus soli]|uniref:YdeI/OmpD-associated family protein n=1 Tax=Polluticoccus soli TaxID=3034150 RepID=UPI0023E2D91D|nr:YdeI/OmpD-associated family protein [Flavipsychrobacter sp. JY13-12]